MAIETALLTTFLANAFVAANNVVSDITIDGGVANAVSCLPSFMRRDTSFEGKVKNLAKGLDAQLGKKDAHLTDQIIANAEAIILAATPEGLMPLLKTKGLKGADIWAKLIEQNSNGAKILNDADTKTHIHTEWLVVQGLELWLTEPNTLNAMRREVFDTIFRMARDIETIKNSAVHVLPLTKAQIEALIEDFGHQGIREADYYTQLSQSAQTLQALQAQLEALTNDDPEVLAKRDAAEKAIDEGRFDLAAELLEEAEAIDAARIEEIERDVLRPRRESQAKSAYTRALLAESQINFQDAYTHALRAHELVPDNYDYLFKAQERALHAGYYKKGLELGEKMIAHTKINHGEESQEYAAACNQTANCARLSGDLKKAEPLYRRAIKIGEENLGPNHPDLAAHINNLAGLLRQNGDLDAAEPLYRRAIKIGEEKLGPNHPYLAANLNNLANLLRQNGDLDAAEPLYRRAIKIGEEKLGPKHPELAAWLNNLAGLLEDKGDFDEAEPLYRRAIKISEEKLGPNHPDLAANLNNLAGLLRQKGDLDAAEPLYQRAIAILENAFPDGHPNLDQGRKNYAIMQAERDQK